MTIRKLITVLLIVLANVSLGATHYVSSTGSHTSPYDTWETAATNIQDAVDVAVAGETVLVADGEYVLDSQILIANAITLRSQNSLGATIDGNGSVRCLRVTASNVVIDGFRIRRGYLSGANSANYFGANIYCNSDSVTVQNCEISEGKIRVSTHAVGRGGGAYNGSYINCEFLDNHTIYYGNSVGAVEVRGGAAYSCLLEDCYVAGNTSTRESGAIADPARLFGGGLYACEAVRCVLENNIARFSGSAAQNSTLQNCLVTGNECQKLSLTAPATLKNCTVESSTIVDNIGQGIYDGSATNCIIYGNTVTNWAGTVSISYSCTTPDPGGTGNITQFSGLENDYLPPFDSELLNAGINQSWMTGDTDLRGAPRISDSTVDMGCYELGTHHYVSPSGSMGSPYSSWATAATDIQSAIDACTPWDVVIVADNVYTITQQVLVATDNVTVQSVNGPWETSIAGNGATRCLRITASGVTINGFHVQDGYLSGSSGNLFGANIYCDDDSAIVRNCIISGAESRAGTNAKALGGGAYNGTYIHCSFTNNSVLFTGTGWTSLGQVRGGAAYSCILENCHIADNTSSRVSGSATGPKQYGGGLFNCDAVNCILEGNYARTGGGAQNGGTLRNSLVIENQSGQGAGVRSVKAENCTIADNTGEGIYAGSATNCIIFGNTGANWAGTVDIAYSCTTPDPGGTGNILSFEGFAQDYYPQAGSVALDSALEMSWMTGGTDLYGFPRVIDSGPDMGCQEYFGTRGIDSIEVQGNDAILMFDLFDGVTGMLQATDDLTNSWADVTSFSGAGTITVTNHASGSSCKFFRLKYESPYTKAVGAYIP